MHEYAFDVKLQTVIRVNAESVEEAREKVEDLLAVSLEDLPRHECRLTEFSAENVSGPFEIDGIDQGV